MNDAPCLFVFSHYNRIFAQPISRSAIYARAEPTESTAMQVHVRAQVLRTLHAQSAGSVAVRCKENRRRRMRFDDLEKNGAREGAAR